MKDLQDQLLNMRERARYFLIIWVTKSKVVLARTCALNLPIPNAAWSAQTPQSARNLQWRRSPDTIRCINNHSMEILYPHGFPTRQEQKLSRY